jgi:hypothetical protein
MWYGVKMCGKACGVRSCYDGRGMCTTLPENLDHVVLLLFFVNWLLSSLSDPHQPKLHSLYDRNKEIFNCKNLVWRITISINLWYKEALFFKKSLRQRGRNEARVLVVEERASLLQAVATSFEQVASQKQQRKSVLRPFGRSLPDLLLPFFLSVEIARTPSG